MSQKIKTDFGMLLEIQGKGDSDTIKRVEEILDDAYDKIKEVENEYGSDNEWQYYS